MHLAIGELLARFLIGGVIVSFFAVLAEMFRPKSFAGLFGAAPSIALATIGITISGHGKAYAAVEARSMIFGAIAFLLYAASRELDADSLSSRALLRQPSLSCRCGLPLHSHSGSWRDNRHDRPCQALRDQRHQAARMDHPLRYSVELYA